MRKGAILVGLGLVAALAWWLWPRDTSLARALPANTVSVVALERPHLLVRRIDGVAGPLAGKLGSISSWFTPDTRAADFGFDPTEGFASIGVGAGGAALARLATLADPVLCLDLYQRERFTAWLAERSGKTAGFDDGALRVGDDAWPIAARGSWVCFGRPGADMAAAFDVEARLADAPLAGDLRRPEMLVQAGWSARQATRWAHAQGKATLAADLGHLAAYVRSATAHLGAALEVKIALTDEGRQLADALFADPKPVAISRFLAMPGWGAARLSLALPTATEALATALPPSAPATQRQALTLGQMALPMTAGINWQQLVAALDGTVAVGVDLSILTGKPHTILVLGVKDASAARAAAKAVAKKFGSGGGLLGMGTAKTEAVGANGVEAWRLEFKTGNAWMHLADDALVIASHPDVLAASLAPRAVDPAWTVLDQAGAVLAVAADLPALRARLPATAPQLGLDGKTLALAIQRTPAALALLVGDRSGVRLDTLMGLGLWARGQVKAGGEGEASDQAESAQPVKAPSPSPAKP